MNAIDRQRLREKVLEVQAGGEVEDFSDALLDLIDHVSEVENHYFRALDEVFLLRVQMEYEAGIREADLGLKTFPKSRRKYAEEAIERMREAAEGKVAEVSSERNQYGGPTYRRMIGARTLSRWEWENEDA